MVDLAGIDPPRTSTPIAREPFTPLRQRVMKRLALAGAGLSAIALALALMIV
jgi:hypothetical protein